MHTVNALIKSAFTSFEFIIHPVYSCLKNFRPFSIFSPRNYGCFILNFYSQPFSSYICALSVFIYIIEMPSA